MSLDSVHGCGDKHQRQRCAFMMFGDSKRGKKRKWRKASEELHKFPRARPGFEIFGEFSAERLSRWLEEITSDGKVPDCFQQVINYSDFQCL